MSIRTFRNKVLRYKFGLDGLRSMRGPRRYRRSLRRFAAAQEKLREKSNQEAAARAKSIQNRIASSSSAKSGVLGGVAKAARSLFNKAFGRQKG